MTSSSKFFILIILILSVAFATETTTGGISTTELVEGDQCDQIVCEDNTVLATCYIINGICTCPVGPMCPEVEVGGCGGVAPEYIQECCDTWVTDNNLPMPPCKGEWEIHEGECSWLCMEEEATLTDCGMICPSGTEIECKLVNEECICDQECPEEAWDSTEETEEKFVCEDYTCPDGKIAHCQGDENSCTCETCDVWEEEIGEPEGLWRNAEVECMDGHKEKMGDPTACKSPDLWHKYADEICHGRCNSAKECGLNSFVIRESCSETAIPVLDEVTSVETGGASSGGGGKGFMCPPGMCMHKEKVTCVNQGTVAEVTGEVMYCSLDSIWQTTGGENAACLNNYECKSNFCSNGKCLDLQKELAEQRGLLDQILEFFAKLFGMA